MVSKSRSGQDATDLNSVRGGDKYCSRLSSNLLTAIVVLALLIVGCSLLVGVADESDAATYSGNCGSDVTYTLNTDTGVLAITGTGDMANYGLDTSPWYSHKDDIKTVTVGNGVTTIGSGAFYKCASLTSIEISNTVTSIGNYAFSQCTSLGSITIPGSVTTIGSNAFYYCTSLATVTIGESSGLISIDYNAFYQCTELTSIEIPDSVTSIGAAAFASCSKLKEVTIGNSVTSIGAGAFASCSKLKEVTIGNSVTSIGAGAFASCSKLKEVTIGNSVTSIGAGAFASCSKLKEVTIGNSVTSIGAGAFASCSKLKEVTIGNSVTSIGSSAFRGLTFYDSDGTTELQQTVANLAGYTFTGNGDGKLTRSGSSTTTYTITFVTEGTSCEDISVTAGQPIGTLPTTTRTGYAFDGWFTSASGGTKVTSSHTPTNDMTLYAQWTADTAPVVDPDDDTDSKTKGLDTNGQFLLVTFAVIISLAALALIITRKR